MRAAQERAGYPQLLTPDNPERSTSLSGGVALIAGRYELVRELGIEGDVIVWEGFDANLERRVLVQLLRQPLADDHATVQRFWQAARTAARSTNPLGDRILDGGADPDTGRVFVVREWPQRRSANDDTVAMLQPPTHLLRRPFRFNFTSGRLAVLGLFVVAVVGLSPLRSVAAAWLTWINEPVKDVSHTPTPSAIEAPQGQAAPTAVGPAPTVAGTADQNAAPGRSPTSRATPGATPTPEQSGVPRRIANTDGRGVALRSAPGGDHLPGKGYDEGVTVTAFESSGEWTRIRGADGREGWVLSVTLAP